MTNNKYSDTLEHFRAFASASINLLKALSAVEPHSNHELRAAIFLALRSFPDEVYEDAEVIGLLDALVDERPRLDSSFEEPWGSFLLSLGFAHLRRYALLGEPRSLERARRLSELASSSVPRTAFPRLWAITQVLVGDSMRLVLFVSRDLNLDPSEHYRNALEIIQRDQEPLTWIYIAERLGRAYAEKTTGDRDQNLIRAGDVFKEVQNTWEEIGNINKVVETQVAFADVLANLNLDEQELEMALVSYRFAYTSFIRIGDDPAAIEVARKINALESVNFTAYYPRSGAPGRKYGFVVYAHLPELITDVHLDAQKFSEDFGDSMPTPRRSRSSVKIKRDSLITVVPECNQLKFDPPELTKRWDGSLTRFPFDFELDQETVGEVIMVRVSIQVAGVEIASIDNCAIEVIEPQQPDASENPLALAKAASRTSALYQKIFVSYSRQDREITERYKLAQTALGNEAFIDVDNLRAGEDWKAGLAKAIDVADVFQLFWSINSANSEYCRYEWTYALESRCADSKCDGFIRPVYWQKPMPHPPPELGDINFKYVPFGNDADRA